MQEPPLMLGPVYLHWDGSYETYRAFFAHLRCKLDNININGLEFGVWDLIVGSDEDRALRKAVETCFPQATTLLCCRHFRVKPLQHRGRASRRPVRSRRQHVLRGVGGPDHRRRRREITRGRSMAWVPPTVSFQSSCDERYALVACYCGIGRDGTEPCGTLSALQQPILSHHKLVDIYTCFWP